MTSPPDRRSTDAARSQPHWSDPGPELVAEGVHRIPLPLPTDGLRAVNVYVLESDQGLTLIDGGWAIAESRALLESSLRELGHGPRDITSFLVTHVHRDHYTQAVAVRTEFGRAAVSLGERERDGLAFAHSASDPPFADRLRACGADAEAAGWQGWAGEAPNPADWLPPDFWLTDQQTIHVGQRRLRVVHTPGHTAGHVVFADLEAGLLFAGDHVLPEITPSIGFEVPVQPEPLRDFLSSLVRIQELPDLRLLPAHGPVGGSSHARVSALAAHHEARLQLSLDAVLAGLSTPREVAGVLPWTKRDTPYDRLDVFNGGLAVFETKMHLDLLVGRDQLERSLVDGVWRYQPVFG